jgi:hypothetical protein
VKGIITAFLDVLSEITFRPAEGWAALVEKAVGRSCHVGRVRAGLVDEGIVISPQFHGKAGRIFASNTALSIGDAISQWLLRIMGQPLPARRIPTTSPNTRVLCPRASCERRRDSCIKVWN